MTHNNDIIKINMLGEFSITNGTEIIGMHENRSHKVWMLIEFLISNRKSTISQEALFDMLWSDFEECENPTNALKNLVYRARKELSKLSNGIKQEYIIFARNTYMWNNNIDVVVDVELFEKLCVRAGEINDNGQKINNYFEALYLYKGEFLPKSSFSDWVISKSTYYMTLYIQCVIKLSILLAQKNYYRDIIEVCERAIQLYPFEEPIHYNLLNAYIKNGEKKKALNHYAKTNDMFYRELGVNVSNNIKGLYKEIIKSISEVELDIASINEDLEEAYNEKGAFFCDYEIFKNIYRVQARSIIRTGQAIQLVLITVENHNNQRHEPKSLKVIMNNLKDAILSSLRKGDSVSNYSTLQFVLLLPLTNYENCNIVIKRIQDNFNKMYKKGDVNLNVTIRSVVPNDN